MNSSGWLATFYDRARGFLHWWGTGLAGALPASLKGWLAPEGRRLEVKLTGASALLAVTDGGSRLGEVSVDRPEDIDPAVFMRLPDLKGVSGITLELPQQQVLLRSVEWPLKAEQHLSEALTYQIEKLIPLASDAVFHGHRVLRRDTGKGTFVFEVAAVVRSTVEPWLDAVARDKLSGLPVDLSMEGRDGLFRLNLVGRLQRGGARGGIKRGGLVSVFGLLAALAIGLPLMTKHDHLERVDEAIARLQQPAEQAGDLRQRLQASLSGIQNIIEERRGRYGVLAVLEELAQRLPDTAYLQRFEMRGDTVKVVGEAQKSTELVELLKASTLFGSVEFAAPVSRNPRTGMDRFQFDILLSTPGDGHVG